MNAIKNSIRIKQLGNTIPFVTTERIVKFIYQHI